MRVQIAIIVLSVLLPASSRVAQAQRVDLKEVERDWEFLEQACKRRVIRFTVTLPPTSKGRRLFPRSGRCVADGASVWLSVQTYTSAPPQHDEVYGMHHNYAFQLVRRAPDAPYLLTSLGKPAGPLLEKLEQEMNASYSCNVPWAAQYKPLRLWLKDPGFHLKSIRREVEAGVPLVVLDCSYAPPKGQTNFYFTHAKIKLDPANRHRFHSAQGEYDLGKFADRVEYADNDEEGRPVPVRYIMTQEVKGRKPVWVCEYHEWTYPKEPIPEAELGLTAFGIPEPAWAKRPPTSTAWKWISAALAGSVALAILFFWLRRRQAVRAVA